MQKVTVVPVKTACFGSDAEWDAWVLASHEASSAGVGASGPCSDCTPAFKAAMLAAGRCDHPGVTFRLYEGGVQGVRPGTLGRPPNPNARRSKYRKT